MSIIDNVKSGVSNAVETLSDTAQALVEKNRVHAQKNRLKAVIQCENRVIDKALIELGKYYLKNLRDIENTRNEDLCLAIEDSIEKIRRAKERYDLLTQYEESLCVCPCCQQNEANDNDEARDSDDITVACSNEEEYDEDPFDDSMIIRAERIKEDVKEDVKKDEDKKEEKKADEKTSKEKEEPVISRTLSPEDDETADDDLSF